MTIPKTIEGREYKKFVESPTRGPNNTAIEVLVGNIGDIGGDNIETDFADGNISAIKAIYKTINGVALANNNSTEDEATVIGITRTAATDGNKIKYQIIGRMEDSSLNFTLNDPLYLDVSGNITNVAPVTGYRTQIGTSLGVGAIQINIQEPINL